MFRKNLYKARKIRIFENQEYVLWKLVFATPMPNLEAIPQFLVTKLPNKPRKLHMTNFLLQFLEVLDHLQKQKQNNVEFAVKN